ncbi:MAG: ribosome assembly RNA-binding protein YhbY [Myxococcota bacterium]
MDEQALVDSKPLSGAQRRKLRSLAHHLQPVVLVGHKGVTGDLLKAVDRALLDHELIKIKLLESCPIDRKEVGSSLAGPLSAHDVGVVGRVQILYRAHPKDPQIVV